jgi:hypothetical protein
MVKLDCMNEMIAGFVTSLQGQQAVRTFLESPDGQKTIDAYLATPGGQQTARLLLSHALDGLDLPLDTKRQIRTALDTKR